MSKKTTRALSLMLVLVMALSIFAVSYAATTKYAKSAVNVRSGPGTSYAVIGELAKGQSVTATGKTVGNWTQVQFSRYELGYVSSSYLTSKASASNNSSSSSSGNTAFKVCSDCGDIYYATTALNVRKGPGTSYSVIGSLCKGQQVTRIGKSGNWYKLLTTDGTTAYASASYLKLYKASTGSSNSNSSNNSSSTTVSSSVAYATTGLNVRKGPSTSYSIVDELNKGEKVYLTGNVSGNWYQVRTLRGKVGYCYKSYITAKAPAGSSSSSSNACSYYYCYNCKWYVPAGQVCTGCKNVCPGYTACGRPDCSTCNNYKWNCNTGCPVKIGSYYVTNYKTKLYVDDSTTCATVCSLPAGTKVVVVGLSGYDWAKVRVADTVTTGYVTVDSIK